MGVRGPLKQVSVLKSALTIEELTDAIIAPHVETFSRIIQTLQGGGALANKNARLLFWQDAELFKTLLDHCRVRAIGMLHKTWQ